MRSPSFLHNPFLAPWLGAAELARRQAVMLTEFNRQALQFWTGGLVRRAATAPKAVESLVPVTTPVEQSTPVEQPAAVETAPAPEQAAPVPEASPAAAEQHEHTPAKPARAAEPRARTAKPPAQTLRTAHHGRKAAKKAPRVTRH